jgi:two-component system chemotaxis sensor kinase CheA
MDDEMDDVVREFLEESRENLDRVDVDLVTLEKSPDSGEIVGRIFRAVHTIKGTCGFLGYTRLEAVAHAGENVLSALRDEEIASTPAMTSVLLNMVDAIREMVGRIESTGSDGQGDYSVLVAQLTELYRRGAFLPEVAPASEPEVDDDQMTEPEVHADRTTEPELPRVAARPVVTRTTEVATATAADVVPPPADVASSDSSIRVDVALLDKLMNLVGELVLARNQIIQFKGAGGDSTFIGASQRLNLITSELQEGVMKTRMQPIGNIWGKFPRVVRDLAISCEKQVRLEMEGEQTELDKTLIEAIKDPLTHLVRNSVDHGIETPDQRALANKPREGCLRLRAFHEGGQVNIEVSDDGAGLDPARIRLKAIERGMTTPDQAARMGERELLRLIFLPGFSTAAKVTNVSGRGVGMDVVLTNIERIGGTIELMSQPGSGTTIMIKIPLTLAIIRGVIVTSGGNRYVIPQSSVLRLIRLEGAEATRAVELIHGAPVYRLRGKLLPLVYLAEALRESPSEDDAVTIVVLKADERQFGLVVHAVQDTEEIVVKALGKHLKGTAVFAGATIMGDGLVALILDIVGLAKRARVMTEGQERGRQELATVAASSEGAKQTLLLFRSPGDGRMAIPLSRVARLEEFPLSLVERAGDERLVQYRGEIMPVLDLKSVLVERRSASRISDAEAAVTGASSETIQVVVCSHEGGHVGLIVEQIIDIVEDSLAQRRPAGRAGVLGTVVILGRVTELLDVEAMLRCARPGGSSLSPASARDMVMAHGA